jgi:hypothetical protein
MHMMMLNFDAIVKGKGAKTTYSSAGAAFCAPLEEIVGNIFLTHANAQADLARLHL